MISNPVFPPPASNRKEVIQCVKRLLLSHEEYLVSPECKGGDGAPGKMLELLCGARGLNRPMRDVCNLELKYKYGKSNLTLFHKDPVGGQAAFWPWVLSYGKLHDDNSMSFRCTVGRRSKKFRVVLSSGNLVLRPCDESDTREVYWDGNTLKNVASEKLQDILLVNGKVRKDGENRFMTFDSALHLTGFMIDEFFNNIASHYIVLEFDACNNSNPQDPPKRNHGTKFRMNPKHVKYVWNKVETHETIDHWVRR